MKGSTKFLKVNLFSTVVMSLGTLVVLILAIINIYGPYRSPLISIKKLITGNQTELNGEIPSCSTCGIDPPICLNDTDCMFGGECYFGVCICETGFQGPLCESAICPNTTGIVSHCDSDADCDFGGVQSGVCWYNKCICSPNYIGDTCQLERRDLSFCNIDSECLSGGECHINDQSNGECYCASTTTGNNCEP